VQGEEPLYCPDCGTEYVEGVTVCADCGTPLTAEPPREEQIPQEALEFEQVLTTFNAGDIAIIKSLLDGQSIDYYFQGEFFSYTRPLVEPARLLVRKDQVNDVKDILKDLELEYSLNKDVEDWPDD
jgi:zinc-ribbon domain